MIGSNDAKNVESGVALIAIISTITLRGFATYVDQSAAAIFFREWEGEANELREMPNMPSGL